MIKNTTTLGDLTVSQLIKNINSLEEVVKLPGLTPGAIETFSDLLFCAKEVLKLKQAA